MLTLRFIINSKKLQQETRNPSLIDKMGNSQPKIDPKEQAKQNKRTITKAIRQIDRERTKLQNQEAKTLKQIKDLAMKNQHGPAKIMSKDLVRSRTQVKMYYTMAS